jgi:hypothetical protein
MLSDLFAALDEGRPWSLVRLGDGEVQVLKGLHAPWAYIDNHCATVTDAGDLRERSIEAVRGADWVGWHQDPGLTSCMDNAGVLPALYERSVFAWCNLHMGMYRRFVERVLRQEPLFLAGNPMQRWLDEVLRPHGLGKDAVVYGGNTSPASTEDGLRIMDALRESKPRVAFLSLGVWALPVAGYAKAIGKVGIDYGHAPNHHLKPACEDHQERFGPPKVGNGECPRLPACQAHWRYLLNTCCEDSVAGTNEHYTHAGTANQYLPVGELT